MLLQGCCIEYTKWGHAFWTWTWTGRLNVCIILFLVAVLYVNFFFESFSFGRVEFCFIHHQTSVTDSWRCYWMVLLIHSVNYPYDLNNTDLCNKRIDYVCKSLNNEIITPCTYVTCCDKFVGHSIPEFSIFFQ